VSGKLRLVYLGTPEFAVPPLEKCLAAGHEILAVFTQPDRPKGRGQEVASSPVKQFAESRGLSVRQPGKIREAEAELYEQHADAMVVVGYGQIIPQSIIDIAPLGILNVHASLLPKYRGAAPIQRAIAAGETVTGVTTMRIDAGLDTGDILLQAELPIGAEETATELSPRLAALGADLLIETLARLQAGTITPQKQNNAEATLAPVLSKEEGEVDWTLTASEIFNRARGFQPWPGCYTTLRDRKLHILRCRPSEEVLVGRPGSAVARRKQLFVACGHATTLEILDLQLEGRRRALAADFLNGQRIGEDEVLGAVRA
jgi:methionyl-tRNA formyltransferase